MAKQINDLLQGLGVDPDQGPKPKPRSQGQAASHLALALPPRLGACQMAPFDQKMIKDWVRPEAVPRSSRICCGFCWGTSRYAASLVSRYAASSSTARPGMRLDLGDVSSNVGVTALWSRGAGVRGELAEGTGTELDGTASVLDWWEWRVHPRVSTRLVTQARFTGRGTTCPLADERRVQGTHA